MHRSFGWALGAGILAGLGLGIAPAVADIAGAGALPIGPAGVEGDIGKEMTVQNWILCTTQANAESIAKARATGVEPALKVYADLQGTKSCGQFATLKVILRESLYVSPTGQVHTTHVYRASVNLGTDWPTGFVVSGGTTE